MSECMIVDTLSVEVRRSRRRKTRIGLSFDPAGVVVLEAPQNATRRELVAVVRAHRRWLQGRLEEIAGEAACVAQPRHTSGERVQYLGAAYELEVVAGSPSVRRVEATTQLPLFVDVHGIRGRVVVATPDPDPIRVRALLRRWYTHEALGLVADSLERYRGLPWLGDRRPEWRVGYMRSQWGSCSGSGKLALNVQLAKVPERLIDYVVLHELCHLAHHDHGARFYALLEAHMSDWRAREADLDRYLPVLLHD